MSTRRSLALRRRRSRRCRGWRPSPPAWSSSAAWSGRAARAPPRPTGWARCAPSRSRSRCDDGVVLHAEVDELAPYADASAVGVRATTDPGVRARLRAQPRLLALPARGVPRQVPDGVLRPALARPLGAVGPRARDHRPARRRPGPRASTELAPEGRGGPRRPLDGRDVDHRLRRTAPGAVRQAGRGRGADLHRRPAGCDPHRTAEPLDPRRARPDGGAAPDRGAGQGAGAGRLGSPLRVQHRLPRGRPCSPSAARTSRPRRWSSSTRCWPAPPSTCSPSSSRLLRSSTSSSTSRPSHDVPTTVICGTRDKLTSIGHSRKMAEADPGRPLVECEGAGHMVIFEERDRVNARARGPGGGGLGMSDARDPHGRRLSCGRRARGHPRGVREPPAARPAGHRARRDRRRRCASSLDAHGGLLVEHEGKPVGALMFDPRGRLLGLRRVGVLADVRGLGVAAQMASPGRARSPRSAASPASRSRRAWSCPQTVTVLAQPRVRRVAPRGQPPAHGARCCRRRSRCRPPSRPTPSARALAARLRAGDLLILTGDLGAGKTTLTQGLGEGLGRARRVTSPTFVISRVHPSRGIGPALVHVDAYRLGGAAELDDLDLDTDVDEAVTVVEWGEGLAEALSNDRLELSLRRTRRRRRSSR